MLEGLYKVEFQTQRGAGIGVIYAHDGRIWGGDAGLFYVGSFTEAAGQITADVTVNRHTVDPGIQSVFGIDHVVIRLVGHATGNTVNMAGSAPQAPGVSFKAVLTKIAG